MVSGVVGFDGPLCGIDDVGDVDEGLQLSFGPMYPLEAGVVEDQHSTICSACAGALIGVHDAQPGARPAGAL